MINKQNYQKQNMQTSQDDDDDQKKFDSQMTTTIIVKICQCVTTNLF